jgi:hypothetical protein
MSSTEVFQMAAALAPQVKLPTVSATTSNHDPVVREECRKADLDTAVGEGIRSLDLKAVRILPEAVTAM